MPIFSNISAAIITRVRERRGNNGQEPDHLANGNSNDENLVPDVLGVELSTNDYADDDDYSNETVVEDNYARRILGGDSNADLWLDEDDETQDRQRREIIRNELERIQRSNFFHFMLLLLIPTCLLMVIFINVLTENDDCGSGAEWTTCQKEPRSFMNAFTSRCICEAIRPVSISVTNDGGDEL